MIAQFCFALHVSKTFIIILIPYH